MARLGFSGLLLIFLATNCEHGGPPISFASCKAPPEQAQVVGLRAQETSMWCWAASGEMAMEFLGANVRQCEEANTYLELGNCCDTPVPNVCVNGGWPPFEKYGFKFETTSDQALSWDELKAEIHCAKRPVAFSWHWIGGGGHMMVAVGYRLTGNQKWIDIIDPWPVGTGDRRSITFEEYQSAADHTHWNDYYGIAQK